jgi:hypothetical protein
MLYLLFENSSLLKKSMRSSQYFDLLDLLELLGKSIGVLKRQIYHEVHFKKLILGEIWFIVISAQPQDYI